MITFQFPGYQLQELILEETYFYIYQAYCEQTSEWVTIKVVKEGPRSILENALLRHEYDLVSKLNGPGILRPKALLRHENVLALVSQWVEGFTLKHYFRTRLVSIADFLSIAIQMCQTLHSLHRHQIIHLNIRPDALIYNPLTKRTYLTGFGHAVQMPHHEKSVHNIPLMQSSPPYMAPERTRKMNWGIDSRTDLYAVGITLYELLSKTFPFQGNDSLGWAHVHLAVVPAPFPTDLHIPPILSAIIMKLLNKNPALRYQSAQGLMADLQKCREGIERATEGKPVSFTLGLKDIQLERKSLPTKLNKHADKEKTTEWTSTPIQEELIELVDNAGFDYAHTLDLSSIMKASQAFTDEMNLEHLLHRLMHVALENAGGQQAKIITIRQNTLQVIAATSIQNSAYPTDTIIEPFPSHPTFSEIFTRYVVEQEEIVILHDARHAELLANDPYTIVTQPQSMLGVPMLLQGTLIGVFYMENNLADHVFMKDHIHVIQVLVSQMIYAMEMQRFLAEKLHQSVYESVPLANIQISLTDRELEVLRLMAEGMSNQDIADHLFLVVGTVKIHVKNVLNKLHVNNRTKAVAKAHALQLLREPTTR